MADPKPTYEDLERRVRELERERAASGPDPDAATRLALYERIFDQMGEGIAVADLDGALRFCNQRFAELHQYTPDELIGNNLAVFHTREQLQQDVLPFHEKVLAHGQHTGEVGHVRRDGLEFPARMTTTLLRDESGRPAGFIGVMTDISVQKSAEEDLKRTELELRGVLDSMLEHVVYHDVDLNILWANKAAADSVGTTPDRLVGRRCYDVWRHAGAACARCPVIQALETGVPHQEETISEDGRHWFIRGYPIKDDAGALQGAVEFTLDITDRKIAEQALRSSEQLYRSTIDWMEDIIHVVDPDLRVILHNKSFTDINRDLGLTTEILGKTLTDVYPFLAEEVIEQYHEVFATGEMLITEEQNEFDGRAIITETRKIPILDNGRVTRVITLLRDITDRKRAEQELADSEREKAEVLNGMMEHVLYYDRDMKIVWANKAAADSLKMKPRELVGRTCHEIWYGANQPCESCPITRAFKTGKPAQGEVQTPDGKFWSIRASLIRDDSGRIAGAVETALEITDRKRAEQALEQERAALDSIIDMNPYSIVIFDARGGFVRANPACAEMFGAPTPPGYNLFQDPVLKRIGYVDAVLRLTAGHAHVEPGHWYDPHDADSAAPGRRICIRAVTFPICDAAGRVINYVVMHEDITDRRLMEEALVESEQRFRSLFNSHPETIIVLDLEGRITDINRAGALSSGLTREQIIGKHFTDFNAIDKDHIPRYSEMITRLITGEDIGSADLEITTSSGERRWIEIYPSRVTRHGSLTGFQVLTIDITERKHAEIALRESEERFRALFNSHPEPIIVLDVQGRILDINKDMYHPSGLTRDQIIGRHFTDFGAMDDSELSRYLELFQDMIQGRDPGSIEVQLHDPKGRRYWLEIYPSKIIQEGVLTGFQVLTIDITERKRTEQALRQSEERYRNLAESAQDAIFIISRDLLVEYTNEFAAGMFGRTPADLFRTPVQRLFPSDNYEGMSKSLQMVFGNGEPLYRENLVRFGDLNIWLGTQLVALHDETGSVVNAVLGVSRDITERKMAEEALREAKERLEATLNAIPDIMFELADDGRILSFHAPDDDLLYAPPEEFIDKSIADTLPPDVAGPILVAIRICADTQTNVTLEYDLPIQDDPHTFEAVFSPMGGAGGRVISLVRDITGRKRAEQAVRHALDRFEAVVENTPLIAVQGFGRDGTIHLWNSTSETVYGFSAQEALGRKLQDLLLSAEAIPGFLETIEQIWTSGEPMAPAEWPVRTRRGEERWVYSAMFPLFENGEVSEVICMDLDITERRKLDQAKINFLGSISHELRTPLSLILGYAEMLLRENLPHNVRKKLKIIHERGRQELKLVEELITLAQFESGETKFQMRDVQIWDFLERYLSEAHVMLESLIDKRYRSSEFTFEKDLAPDLRGAVVCCDEERIRQVLDNLLENAVKYSEQDRLEFRFTATLDNGSAVLGVHDRGMGVDASEFENIFKPFYQLRQGRHPLSDGMGKGLSIVKDFVKAHGGRIWLESRPGQGSSFFVALPIKEMGEYEQTRSVRTILVVDDDPDFLDFVESLLFSEGFDVIVASNEKETFKVLGKARPDLILLDVQLPDGNGMDMCVKIRGMAEFSNTYIYFLSAKLPAELEIIARESGADGFFSKPFEVDAFLDTINQLQT